MISWVGAVTHIIAGDGHQPEQEANETAEYDKVNMRSHQDDPQGIQDGNQQAGLVIIVGADCSLDDDK